MMSTILLKNGKELTIRKAEKSDAKDMLAYLRVIGAETNYLSFGFEGLGIDVEKEEEFITRFSVATTSVMYVALIENNIVGVGSISAESKSRFSHNAELGISVLKDYWNMGIGSILMQSLIDFSKSTNHLKNIYLEVVSENKRAINLYKKFGFVEVGCHKNFSKVGNKYYDLIIMDLEI